MGIALIWPVGEKGELIGAFLVGQKSKKEAFTSENLQYLSNIQFQTAMAVANALLYKQAVERIATFK
jgi:GAF domain-containing protein